VGQHRSRARPRAGAAGARHPPAPGMAPARLRHPRRGASVHLVEAGVRAARRSAGGNAPAMSRRPGDPRRPRAGLARHAHRPCPGRASRDARGGVEGTPRNVAVADLGRGQLQPVRRARPCQPRRLGSIQWRADHHRGEVRDRGRPGTSRHPRRAGAARTDHRRLSRASAPDDSHPDAPRRRRHSQPPASRAVRAALLTPGPAWPGSRPLAAAPACRRKARARWSARRLQLAPGSWLARYVGREPSSTASGQRPERDCDGQGRLPDRQRT
jgi:hypothetical protein